jgi:hypothetical protein
MKISSEHKETRMHAQKCWGKKDFITSLINYIYSFTKQTYFWGHHHWFQTQNTQLHCPLRDMNWDRLNKINTEFYSQMQLKIP